MTKKARIAAGRYTPSRSGATVSKCLDRSFALLLALALCMPAFADIPVPAPGASPRIDAIKKAGVLRVGVLANAPWLVENTTGQGAAWSGPAWLLASEYAKRLNVKLECSHRTRSTFR